MKGMKKKAFKSMVAFVVAFTMIMSFPSAVFAGASNDDPGQTAYQTVAEQTATPQDQSGDQSQEQASEQTENQNNKGDQTGDSDAAVNSTSKTKAASAKGFGDRDDDRDEEITVTLVYCDSDGNTIKGVDSDTITIGEDAVTLSEKAKTIEGYSYNGAVLGRYLQAPVVQLKVDDGWLRYRSSSGSRWGATSARTVYMKYEENKEHKISFDLNGGTGKTPASLKAKSGDEITMPTADGLSKSGASFIGWSSDKSANDTKDGYSSSKIYKAGDKCYFTELTKDKTYYAIWGSDSAPAQFFIKLDGDEPAEPSHYDSRLYTAGITVADALKVNKNIANDDAAVAANIKTAPTDADIAAKAKAKGIKYDPQTQYVKWYVIKEEGDGSKHVDGIIKNASMISLKYNPNADLSELKGSCPSGKEYKKDTEVTVSDEGTLTREGYTFTGWNTEKSGNGTAYAAGSKITLKENTTLYAQWSPKNGIKYQVKYYTEKRDGTYELYKTSDKTGRTGETVSAAPITIGGFTFDSENTNNVTSAKVKGDGTTVLKLYYKANTYKITYYDEDGSTVIADYTGKRAGDDVDVPDASDVPTKAQDNTYTYGFDHWELTKGETASGKVGTTDLEYTAVYAKTFRNYTVTFKYPNDILNGKTISTNDKYHYNDDLTAPADPETIVNGDYTYTFTGWDKEPSKKVTGNTVYTATFDKTATKHKVTVNYYYQGTNVTAAPSVEKSIAYGQAYTVDSPAVKGYTADTKTVSGTMGAEDKVVNVYYSKNAYNLNVKYFYAGTTTPVAGTTPYSASVEYDAAYSVASPEVTGYTADRTAVSGTMGTENVNEIVYYTANEYTVTFKYPEDIKNGENISARNDYHYNDDLTAPADPETIVNGDYTYTFTGWDKELSKKVTEDAVYTATFDKTATEHKVTVNYYFEGTKDKVAEPKEETVAYNDDYSIGSPSKEGYTADRTSVSGTMGKEDVTETVYYTANTDTKYTIEYYYQKDGKYPTTATTSKQEEGTTDTTVTLTDDQKTPSAIYGKYILDPAAANVFTADIKGDESTTLKVYYKEQISVAFLDYNDNVLSSTDYDYGADVVIPDDPTRAGTAEYSYEFEKWVPKQVIEARSAARTKDDSKTAAVEKKATKDMTYSASYKEIPNEYTVTVNYYKDGTTEKLAETSSAQVAYNGTYSIASPNPEGYTLKNSAQETVSGKLTEAKDITVDVYYTANSYTVTYLDDNGTQLKKYSEKHIGDDIEKPDDPTKASDGNNTYVFGKWDLTTGTEGANGKVGSTDLVYTAVYAASPLSVYTLTVNYVDEDGNAVADAYTEQLKDGREYSVASPDPDGYTIIDPAQKTISGKIKSDTTVNVVYEKDEAVTPKDNDQKDNDQNDNDKKDSGDNNTAKTVTAKAASAKSTTKTGDESDMSLWMLIAMMGLAGAIVPAVVRRKEKKESK
ncbi:MAG: InlB B-repeat-containing protein [Eubacteriaceae bacterium]|nr:InlB B-repeat-containing protein [Eubacteriaceae bacterium]